METNRRALVSYVRTVHLCTEEREWSQWCLYEVLSPYCVPKVMVVWPDEARETPVPRGNHTVANGHATVGIGRSMALPSSERWRRGLNIAFYGSECRVRHRHTGRSVVDEAAKAPAVRRKPLKGHS